MRGFHRFITRRFAAAQRTAVTWLESAFLLFAGKMDAGSSASITAVAQSSQTATDFRWKALKRLVFLAPT
jgi:hypothetical protein